MCQTWGVGAVCTGGAVCPTGLQPYIFRPYIINPYVRNTYVPTPYGQSLAVAIFLRRHLLRAADARQPGRQEGRKREQWGWPYERRLSVCLSAAKVRPLRTARVWGAAGHSQTAISFSSPPPAPAGDDSWRRVLASARQRLANKAAFFFSSPLAGKHATPPHTG